MNHFLDIQNLSCGYGGGFRVHGINLSLPEGSFAGIIGPNGSGKTTLFRGISGTLPLKDGRILLEGSDLSKLTWREKAQKLAIVSQFSETAELSVEEYVLMGRLPYRQRFQFFDRKEDIEIAPHYMHLTNTYRLRNKSMAELSDFLMMMKDGTTFCQGAPEEVLTYQHIENVYNTVVIVKTNPISGKPVVFPVSEQRLRNGKK